MELLLVRHALPATAEEDPQRRDPGLGAVGRAQAAALSRFLAAEEISAIMQSPARRARETAEPIAAAHGLAPTTVPELAEFDWATADYLTSEELQAIGDYRWQALARGELYDVDPHEFQERVARAMDNIIHAHAGGRVVVVSHGGVINAYLARLAGTAKIYWIGLGVTSISRVRANRSGVRTISTIGEVGHLRDLLLPEANEVRLAAPDGVA